MAETKARKKVTVEFEASTLWKAGTIIFAVLFIIAIMTGGFKGSGSAPTRTAQVTVPQAAPSQQPVIKADVDITGEPMIGKKNAPVTIIEFSDYQCPFCQRAFTTTFPEIRKLVDEGKVAYYVKDFPLAFHTEADEAAIAANCAGDQGKYWEMHDKLFEAQTTWAGNADPTGIFTGYVADLGLDEGDFTSCIADPAQRKEVEQDIAEGTAAGVSGTPTFYINGQQLVGAQPWAAFKTVIDAELA